jgi:integrase
VARPGEGISLTWLQVDLLDKTLRVGRAKTSNGTGRTIPIDDELASVLTAHGAWFLERFGEPSRINTCFPGESLYPPTRRDTQPLLRRDRTGSERTQGVSCRLHDLRHTFATRLAENSASKSTMLALMGQMSRAMLERYSHIRMAAKREALVGITLQQKGESSETVPVRVELGLVQQCVTY